MNKLTVNHIILAIAAFLAVMIITDHANVSAILQWQTDYGKKIDRMTAALNMLEMKGAYTPMAAPAGAHLGMSTSTVNADP